MPSYSTVMSASLIKQQRTNNNKLVNATDYFETEGLQYLSSAQQKEGHTVTHNRHMQDAGTKWTRYHDNTRYRN